jgi:hypothetical protein
VRQTARFFLLEGSSHEAKRRFPSPTQLPHNIVICKKTPTVLKTGSCYHFISWRCLENGTAYNKLSVEDVE